MAGIIKCFQNAINIYRMNRFTFIIITFIRSIKKKKVVIVSEAFKASGKIASFTKRLFRLLLVLQFSVLHITVFRGSNRMKKNKLFQ